jgi:hypothetical protein
MVLIVVFLLFIQPIALDRILLNETLRGVATGQLLIVAGLVVTVLLSETLLVGLQLGLGSRFRVPYYLFMGLFFLYPVLLQQVLEARGPLAARWAIFAFPSVAGLVTLTLLPLAWQAERAIAHTRSPWPWPYLPWSVFVFLGVGVVIRTVMLAISFDSSQEAGIAFASFWLVPFAFAVLLVVFEAGRAAHRESVMQLVTMIACAVPVLAVENGHWMNPVYGRFWRSYAEVLGPPPLLALACLALFLFMAWRRGVRWAEGGLLLVLLLLTVVGRWTMVYISWDPPRAWPLALLAVMQLGAWRLSSWRALTAGLAGGGALHVAWPIDLPGPPSLQAAATVNVCMIFVVIVSAAFTDEMARFLRWAVGVAATVASFAALTAAVEGGGLRSLLPPLPITMAAGNILCWLVLFTVLGFWLRSWSFKCGAIGQGMVLLVWGGIGVYHLTRGTALEAGATAIAAGLVIFVVAAGISLVKAKRGGFLKSSKPP